MKPFGVFCVTDNLRAGGAQRVALTVARLIFERKRLCGFFLLNPSGAVYSEETQGLPVVGLLGKGWNKFLFPVCIFSLWVRVVLYKPRVIFSTLLLSNILSVIVGRGLFRRPKIAIREANTLYYSAKMRGGIFLWMLRAARLFYPTADVVIAPSQGVADDLVEHVNVPKHKVKVIHNPVAISDLLTKAAEAVDHRFLTERRGSVFVAVGRLARAKGLDVLLSAFHLVYKKNPEARLIVLGEGALRCELERIRIELGLDDVVDFPGFIENPFPYMRAADVFVLSSRWEGLPNVLIQAIACGTTSVSTNCPSGPNEILADGKYGYLVPVDNVDALAEKMQLAVKRPVDDSLLKECASRFDEDRILAEYMQLFDELEGGRAR